MVSCEHNCILTNKIDLIWSCRSKLCYEQNSWSLQKLGKKQGSKWQILIKNLYCHGSYQKYFESTHFVYEKSHFWKLIKFDFDVFSEFALQYPIKHKWYQILSQIVHANFKKRHISTFKCKKVCSEIFLVRYNTKNL